MLGAYDRQTRIDLGLETVTADTIPDWAFEGFWLGNEARQLHRALTLWGVTFNEYMAQPREYWTDMFVIEDIINTKFAENLDEKRQRDEKR